MKQRISVSNGRLSGPRWQHTPQQREKWIISRANETDVSIDPFTTLVWVLMQEDRFWTIIDTDLREDHFFDYVHSALCDMGRDEILSFHNILTKKLAEACTFSLLAANFVIQSYVSDDGFREFRAWLVSQGREKFNRAIANPESIADWLDKEVVDDIDGDSMLSVAQDAYGDEHEFLQKASFEPDPKITQEWPENKADFRKKYPKLVGKFWNDERIREMHPD